MKGGSKMITKGNVSTFSFYVRAFDTKNNYRNYGEPATQLSLEQAKEEFAKRCECKYDAWGGVFLQERRTQ